VLSPVLRDLVVTEVHAVLAVHVSTAGTNSSNVSDERIYQAKD
jgi:hypothetical protein